MGGAVVPSFGTGKKREMLGLADMEGMTRTMASYSATLAFVGGSIPSSTRM
jgi:hypothetical protein